MPEISDVDQGDASWKNFWVGQFLFDRVQRSPDIRLESVPDGGLMLAVVAVLDQEAEVAVIAVPTATLAAYVCQESKRCVLSVCSVCLLGGVCARCIHRTPGRVIVGDSGLCVVV